MVLRKRADFLAAAKALRSSGPAFTLQGRQRPSDDGGFRVGFTCSKKVGNAVQRNRAKRRLRAAAWEVLRTEARPGWDYVLIGRPVLTASRPFTELCADLEAAVRAVHSRARG